MNQTEKFEDIIASKFSEAEFPFDERNWDRVEEKIDAHHKKEKRKRFAFIFSSGIILGLLVMLPFIGKKNATTPTNTESIVVSKELTTESDVADKALQEQNKALAELKQQLALAEQKANELNAKNKELIAENKKKVENRNALSGLTKGNSTSATAIASGNGKNVNVPFFMQNKAIAKQQPTETSILLATAKPDYLRKITLNLDALQNNAPASDALNNNYVKVDFKNLKSTKKAWNFTAAVGGNFTNTFSSNPIQGIEASKPLGEKLEVGTGAYYTYLTVLSGNIKTIVLDTKYDFGYQSDVAEIKTNKLHYVVIPVFAKYNINPKNAVIAGANIYTLVTSSNSYTTYKESYGEKTNVLSKKTAGYSNGVNNYDIGLLAGYKRHLFGQMGAAVYLNYGLKDIKKNDYFNENKFERNVSAQVMLTYKL